MFFIVVVTFYSPTNGAQWSGFLHILTNTCYFLFVFFNSSHPKECEVISHYGFDLHFSDN